MSAWSFPKKDSVLESTSRLVTAESLDGQHVRGRLTVHFERPLPAEAAAEILAAAGRALEVIVGEELCEGKLPFSGAELSERIRKRWRGMSPRVSEIRIDGLELAERKVAASMRAPSAPQAMAARGEPVSSGSSGVMPRAVAAGDVRTLWPRASLGTVDGIPIERLVRLYAPALRDSTAAVMIALFQSLDPGAFDRLGLFERRAASPAADVVRRQACACLSAAFHRVLVNAPVDAATSRAIVDGVYREALSPESPIPAELERYLASPAPLRELARSVAAFLGAPADAERMLGAVSAYGVALRRDLEVAASRVKRVYGAA